MKNTVTGVEGFDQTLYTDFQGLGTSRFVVSCLKI